MKQNYKLFGFAAMAALLLSGCSKDVTDDVVKPEEETFTLIVVPNEKIEALTEDGTRTYWDEEFGNVKWCEKDEKFAFCINNIGHWLTGSPLADGIHITLGKYDYPDLYEEGVPFLLAGVIPNDALGNRDNAPKKLEIRLKTEQNDGDITTFDRYCDFLVAAQEVIPEMVEGNDKLSIDKTFKADGYQFVRPMAISKYTFPVTNESLTADEAVESVMLTVVPGENNAQKLLTGSLYMNIGEKPAKVVDANGQQIDLRTPFQSGSPSVGITYPLDAQPKLGELVFWPVTAPVKLEAGDMLRFRIVTNKHEITKEIVLTKDLVYANNKLNRGTVKLDADTKVHSYDATIDLSAEGTANSYIVNKPRSSYKFRADVKGNGIARSNMGVLPDNEANLKIEPKAAVVLWYNTVQTDRGNWLRDCPIVLESVKLVDNYIEFSTPETFLNGNILIAVIDQPLAADEITVDPTTRQFTNTNILWSWNLICSNGYDINDATQTVTKGGYTFMTRDLGAVLDANETLNGYTKAATQGNIYQWGRKDPLPTIPDYESNDVPHATGGLQFTPTFTTVPGLEIEGELGTYGKVDKQIFGNKKEHLLTYLYSESVTGITGYTNEEAMDMATKLPYRWFNASASGDDQRFRWIREMAKGRAIWGNPDSETEFKSIYDPCPVGWRVASEKAWMALTDDLTVEVTAKNKYFYFSTGLAFPVWEGRNTDGISGYMNIGGGSGNVCSARYMTSTTFDAWGLKAVYFRISALKGNYDKNPEAKCEIINSYNICYPTLGSRVRCVKDNE